MAWLLLASNDTQSLEANPVHRIYLIATRQAKEIKMLQ